MKININIVYATCRLAIVLSIPQFTKLFSCLVTGTLELSSIPIPMLYTTRSNGFSLFSLSHNSHLWNPKNLHHTSMVSLWCKCKTASDA